MQIKNGALATDELVAYDASGSPVTGLVNGDWTKALYNPSGAEVSGSVTVTVTELGSGGYRATWTPNALGQWLLILTNAANDLAFASNYECLTGILGDVYTDTDAIDGRLPSDPADESLQQAAHAQTQADVAALNDIDQAGVQAAMTSQGYTTARAPNLDNLDAAITSRAVAGDEMALTSAAEASLVDATWREPVADHSGVAGSTAEALVNAAAVTSPAAIADAVWEETLADHSGTAGSTAEALAAVSAALTGARQIDITIEDTDSNKLQGAQVDLYDAANTQFIARVYSDVNGECAFALDDGSYNLRIFKSGYGFTVPEPLTVTADASETYQGTIDIVISPPSGPDLCVIYGYVYDAGGTAVGGACVSAVPTLPQAVDDKQQAERAIHTATREDGYFEIELLRTAEVRFEIEFTDFNEIKTVPDAASQDFVSWP